MKLGNSIAAFFLVSALLCGGVARGHPLSHQSGVSRDADGASALAGGGQSYEALRERFGDPVVLRRGDSATVSFIDNQTGRLEVFEFVKSAPSLRLAHQLYASGHTWVSSGWVLSRYETDKMSRDASKFAAIYAVAALIPGAQAMIVGAAIEGAWSAHAASYYSRGNCMKIYPWLTVSEAKFGTKGCY